MVAGSGIRGHLLVTLSVFFLTVLLLAVEIGAFQEASQRYYGGKQLQEQISNRGDLVVSMRKVAVIGAGAGGSSTAYYLQKFAANKSFDVSITVYEKNSYVGGRSTTVNVYNNPDEVVELGASIFVEVNENLYNATKEFGLECSDNYISRRVSKDALGVYDGQSFIFRQPYDTTWWNNLAILWKYGLTPIRTQQLMKQTIRKFLQLYRAPLFPFRSLTEAAEKADLLQATAHTGEQFLNSNGVGGKYATDLVQASTRVNYAQNLGIIHGLETMVCMATDNAMSVKGGNWKIFSGMLAASNAKVRLNTAVTELHKSPSDGRWIVYSTQGASHQGHEDSEGTPTFQSEVFDVVVLASPFQFSDIEIHPEPEKTPDIIPYVQLHVTLFTSPLRLSPDYFHLPADQEVPDMVLTTLNATEQQNEKITRGGGVHGVGSSGFFSVSLLRSIKREVSGVHKIEYLYKIFSPAEMTHSHIKEFLGVKKGNVEDVDDAVVTWSHKKVWHSYPYLYPRVTFEEIILDKEQTLFYTSGIESFISTMETSSLMGINVAQLVVDSWESKEKASKKAQDEMWAKAKL
ncbi:putative prenylcysteine lyase [Terfezia boudieri ATCC MYA-4762]|uniref:Putative prenylcysteine lyase n=1 Tax=Terfezia boudieri ATCC MYA-4762 TaxID=1051890 RepID=A0A3N4LRT9_9PEZI|nr:putative prenylcysteine lyase [Terfezia boudieri ATCC MYA-4762]